MIYDSLIYPVESELPIIKDSKILTKQNIEEILLTNLSSYIQVFQIVNDSPLENPDIYIQSSITKEKIQIYSPNYLTTIFTIWNNKNWYKIFAIGEDPMSDNESFLDWIIYIKELIDSTKIKRNYTCFFDGTSVFHYNKDQELQFLKRARNMIYLYDLETLKNFTNYQSDYEKLYKDFNSLSFIKDQADENNEHFPETNFFENMKFFLKEIKEENIWNYEFDANIENEFQSLISFYEKGNSLKFKTKIPLIHSPIEINMNGKKEGLLYIYKDFGSNKITLYFGDYENAYGDDWNDSPANCNSGTPYNEFITKCIIIENIIYEESNEYKSCSMDEFKKKKSAVGLFWFITLNDEYEFFIYGETFLETFDKIKNMDYKIIL